MLEVGLYTKTRSYSKGGNVSLSDVPRLCAHRIFHTTHTHIHTQQFASQNIPPVWRLL